MSCCNLRCFRSLFTIVSFPYLKVDLFIYLYRDLRPDTVGSARITVKERQVRRSKKRKGIETLRVKHPTPFQAINVLIRDE